MSGERQAFKDALRAVFGPTSTTDTQITAAGYTAVSSTRSELYGINFAASATQVPNIQFVDASATGVATPIIIQFKSVASGIQNIEFTRPLLFEKGIVINASATGAGNLVIDTMWSPLYQPGTFPNV